MAAVKVVPLTCHGHSRPITHLSFSPAMRDDHFYIVSACKDNNPMLRDGITGDWIGTFIGHKGAVWSSRLSADNTYAVTGSADFTAKIWDTDSGECLHTLQHPHIVRAVAFSPGSQPRVVATGCHDKKLRIFDMSRTSGPDSTTTLSSNIGASSSGSDLPYFELGDAHGGIIKSIVWGSDHNIVITAADDNQIRWFDLRNRTLLASFSLEGALGTCEINSISTSPNHHASLLSVAAGKNAYFFDPHTPGQLIKKVTTPHEIASLAIHIGEQKFVVGGSKDTWVRVYSFVDGQELDLHKGHHGPVWSTNFAPNGKLYATGSEDGTVKLWKFCKEPYGLWK